MGNSIEILEEFIKYYEAEATSRKFRGTLSISVDEDEIDALENLINMYKRVLKENEQLRTEVNSLKEKNEELENIIFEKINNELEALADSNNHINTDIIDENNIKYISLIFENCECIRLYPDMFKYLVIKNIVKNKNINCFQYEKGEYWDNLSCSYFAITIFPKGYNQKMGMANRSLKKHLASSNNIVSIYLAYNNGEEEYIYVPWNENNDYINEYQKTQFESDSITIKIEKE